jgi:hypothetical protein
MTVINDRHWIWATNVMDAVTLYILINYLLDNDTVMIQRYVPVRHHVFLISYDFSGRTSGTLWEALGTQV